jgi:1-deoxy-D-xylulose-5-phosphate reductoisomerase
MAKTLRQAEICPIVFRRLADRSRRNPANHGLCAPVARIVPVTMTNRFAHLHYFVDKTGSRGTFPPCTIDILALSMPLPTPESTARRRETTGIAVLGATGSIGQSALEVARHLGKRINVAGLSAHTSLDRLVELTRDFRPQWIVATNEEQARKFCWPGLPGTELLIGEEGLAEAVASENVDTVLAAIVGIAGLRSTLAALAAGKNVALANKETLVAAGPLVVAAARNSGAHIIPIDSEHNAIFQCLQGGRRAELARIILTASGGPFRTWSSERMARATSAEALDHPNWDMGRKISIDSATMMNKALEIIEARWLFGLEAAQIEVVVHPQSIVHSMVEFADGSVLAQLGPPDMRLPIQYALMYPERISGPAPRMDFSQPLALAFEPPDYERFPALRLGLSVAGQGGTAGAAFNASNEVAVEAFLQEKIEFHDILRVVGDVLARHPFQSTPDLDQITAIDLWAREETNKWILD